MLYEINFVNRFVKLCNYLGVKQFVFEYSASGFGTTKQKRSERYKHLYKQLFFIVQIWQTTPDDKRFNKFIDACNTRSTANAF